MNRDSIIGTGRSDTPDGGRRDWPTGIIIGGRTDYPTDGRIEIICGG